MKTMKTIKELLSESTSALSTQEFADLLGIEADTAIRYAATGTIPAFKVGNRWRFDPVELIEWLERNESKRETKK